ncbi:MAG: hypothetical protein J7L92_00270 [Dehalococcoidia bacterium]|nr:hypothetical protein [Dehalococcoidia bacterium]
MSSFVRIERLIPTRAGNQWMGGESNAGQFIGPEQRNVCVGYSPTKRNDDMAHDLVDYLAQNLCYETQGEKDYEEFENHLFPLFFWMKAPQDARIVPVIANGIV